MTKQDIHDIIQILEAHFDSVGREVRNTLTFKFTNSHGDFLPYDSEYLFTQSFDDEEGYYAGEEKVESIKSNLAISYEPVYNWGEKEVEKKLEEEVKKAEFNLKVFKYLDQEFKILNFMEEEEVFFVIQDSEFDETKQPTSTDDLDDDDDFREDDDLFDTEDEYEIDEKVQLKKFNQFK